MSKTFHLPRVPLADWQKQFGAACEERAWAVAAHLLAAHPRDFAAMVMLNEYPTTVAEFATEAPAFALKISNLPGSFEPTPAWRSATVGQIIREHLLCARGALSNNCLNLAHEHLAAAIQLRPRTSAQEVILIAVLTEAAVIVGKMESALATERPDLETTPHIASPHPADIRCAVVDEYHPAFLPSLLSLAVETGSSPEFLDLGVRMIALHMHWPTWRSLTSVSPPGMYALRVAALNVVKEEKGLSPGASDFLVAFVRGAPFNQLPSSTKGDDVQF